MRAVILLDTSTESRGCTVPVADTVLTKSIRSTGAVSYVTISAAICC